jgi:hypothetical protein
VIAVSGGTYQKEGSMAVGKFGKFKVAGVHHKHVARPGWHVHIAPPHAPLKECWVSGKEIFSAELYMVGNTGKQGRLVTGEPRQDVSNEERSAIFDAIEKWERDERSEDDK